VAPIGAAVRRMRFRSRCMYATAIEPGESFTRMRIHHPDHARYCAIIAAQARDTRWLLFSSRRVGYYGTRERRAPVSTGVFRIRAMDQALERDLSVRRGGDLSPDRLPGALLSDSFNAA